MLESIRENSQGLVAKIILGFIILTFAVAGIGSYTNSVDTSVAEVNGVKISQSEFDSAYQSQRNRMAQQFGEMFDTLSSDANYMANFRNSVVDSLIDQELIDQAADNLALRVSDQRIKETIRTMPEFQVEGQFDNNRYLALINQAGFYQSSDFRDYLRVEMTRRQLTTALIASEFALPYQAEQLAKLQNQTRDLRYATISAQQYQASAEVTEQEINQYYQANQDRFQNSEKVKVDYIAIDVADIAKSIEVTDADIETYYQDNIANYRQEEQRRVSHILVELGEDEAAARAQITELQTKIESGEDFAALAQEFSADVFSGENGGDLDWIERGAMDEAFDEAAFGLTEVGSVSDIVETEFGLHLIKLTELRAEQIQPLAEIKDQLRVEVSEAKAQDKFFELQQKVAELAFEVPDTLEDAANEVGIAVKTSPWLSRFGNQAPFDNNQLLDAAFSELVIQERLNSDIIEVNSQLAVVVRVNEYQEANVKPLAEVSEQIKTALISEKASEQAQTTAQELLASFTSGSDITEQLAANGAAFESKTAVARYGSELDGAIAREAFKLAHPQEGKVSATTVSLANGDIAIVEVQKVTAGQALESLASLEQQTSQLLAQSAYQSYVASLKEDAKITRRASVQSSDQMY